MNPLITAVICTYNRKNLLRKAVDSLINQTLEKSKYEILIIDNNSNDGTNDIVNQHYSHIKNIRYILEPRQGVAHARNTGWQNSKGKYVAYLDDDEIAKNDWLEKILNALISTQHLKIGAIGGKAEPMWEVPRPDWLSDPLIIFLSIIDISDKPTIINYDQTIIGGNVVYPKIAIKEVGGFDANISRRQGYNLVNLVGDESYKEGEETILHRNLEKNGYILYYHPEIIIYHHIPKERLTKKWFIRRFFWGGYARTYLYIKEKEECSKRIFSFKIRLLIQYLYHCFLNIFLTIISMLFMKKSSYLIYFCRLSKNLGHIYGLIKIKPK